MLDYSKSKVYVVKNKVNDLVYVGSTTLKLDNRFYLHKSRGSTCSLNYYVKNNFNGNWTNFYIELATDYPCNNKYELSLKEEEVLSQYPNHINKNNPKIPTNNTNTL